MKGLTTPVGFVRAKLQFKSFLVNILIDSGNLFADLISEDLAKRLKLKVSGTPRTVGTASTQGKVTIVGRSNPFYLYLEGVPEAIRIQPYVVKDLAHNINLGQDFLRRCGADMTFRVNGIQLKINGNSTMLKSSSAPITRKSIDTRISKVLDKLKDQANNPMAMDDILDLRINEVQDKVPGVLYADKKKPILCSNTKWNVYSKEEILLSAGCNAIIDLQLGTGIQPGLKDNNVLLEPLRNSNFLNKNMIFVHPGCYYRKGKVTSVLVSNFNNKDITIPADYKIGHICEGTGYASAEINTLDHRPPEELTAAELNERRAYIIESLKLDENKYAREDNELKEEIIKIFLQNWDAVSISSTDLGHTNLMKFHIDIPPGTKPTHSKVRPLNPLMEKDLERQLQEWLDADIIEACSSPWSSALVACKKKNSEKFRWAIDYRKVNELTKKDRFPLSSIEGNLHKLSGATIFSSLDAASAFHCMDIEDDCRDYTSFVTFKGQYRFKRLPFGLCNAPAAYSRLVQMALDRLPSNFCLAYIDDAIVFSNSHHDHLEHLRQVVQVHAISGMKLNLAKCQIFQDEVTYLGHMVSKNGIRMIPSYITKVLEWPLPKTGKELRSFLGFSGYYRSFITDYANLTAEMNKMKLENLVVWTPETQNKFEKLKRCFEAAPVRGYPQYDNPNPFILDTDWSCTNMAAVLSQLQEGKEKFLGCTAQKCNTAQSNYPSFKGELASVILGLHKFEHILRARPFIIRTDSKCIEYLNSMKEYRGIWARWQAFLASFNFKVVHRKGTQQVNADALSRVKGFHPSPDPDPTQEGSYLHDIDDIYTISPTPEITKEVLKQALDSDEALATIRKFVETENKPSCEERKGLTAQGMEYIQVYECLRVKDKLLYYCAPNSTQERLCIPPSLQYVAFKACHDDPTMGHYGINKTFDKMKQRFYWPHLYHDVNMYVSNCISCISKQVNPPKPTHNQHREILSYFGQRVYTDTVGPLTPKSYRGKLCRHFLTIQDGFTRFIQAIPIPSLETEVVAKAIIDNWIYVHSCMETLHSDRGTSYTSQLFLEIMKQLGIHKTVTPPATPQSDRVERAHRCIGNIIRADSRYDEGSWTEKLPACVFAYNAAVNRYTGVSPFQAVYGRLPLMPVDLLFPLPKNIGTTWSTHIETMRNRLQRFSETICKDQQTRIAIDIGRIQGRQKAQLKEGDTCYFFLSQIKRGLSKKLQCRWIGPFTVKRVISDSLIIIYPQGNWAKNPKEISTVVNRVRKVNTDYVPRGIFPPSQYTLDLDTLTDSDAEEMEEVIGFPDTVESSQQESRPIIPSSLPVQPTPLTENLPVKAEQEERDLPTENNTEEENAALEEEEPGNIEVSVSEEDTGLRRSTRAALKQARLKMLRYV